MPGSPPDAGRVSGCRAAPGMPGSPPMRGGSADAGPVPVPGAVADRPGDTGRVSGVSGDFDDFVAARWRELYAVAIITAGDPHAAARETASALAELGRRWEATTEGGAPTMAARAAVLTAALAAAVPPADGTPQGADHDLGARAALRAVLAGAAPTARAALAVSHWWDEPPDLVAACCATDLTTVRAGLGTLEQRLAAAHAEALGREVDEVGWALGAAVTDVLEGVVDEAPVGDPVALVAAASTRGTRRRTRRAVVGAGLALAVGAATALAWPGPATSAAPGPTRDDPSWATLSSWGARGPLVDDRTVTSVAAAARAADPVARVLYAGPVGDTVALVMTGSSPYDPALPAGVPGPALGEGSDGEQGFLRLWTAPTRLGTAALGLVTIEGEATARSGDLVALAVGQDGAGAPPAVLVLTRPTVTDGFVTTGALPQPDGSVVPVVHELALTQGVATVEPGTVGFTPLIAVGGFQGPPAGEPDSDLLLPPSGTPADLADAQRTLLAGVTGHPTDSLETTSALEASVPASAIDLDYVGTYPDFVGTRAQPLRVTVVTTITPDGGRVRTSRLAGADAGADAPWTYLESLSAVPSTDPHALLLLPTGDHPGFVAIAPDGATAQLLTRDGHVRDSARVRQGLATLASVEDPAGTPFRLRVLAPDGHVVYDAVPPTPVELLDVRRRID